MADPTTKQLVLQAVEQLPDDATIEDAMERLYFLAKVERGRADARAGRTVPHEDVARRLGI
jgi:predicted transcriptional regulator